MEINVGTRIFCYAENLWGKVTGRVATSTWVVQWSNGLSRTLEHESVRTFANFAVQYAKQDPELGAAKEPPRTIMPELTETTTSKLTEAERQQIVADNKAVSDLYVKVGGTEPPRPLWRILADAMPKRGTGASHMRMTVPSDVEIVEVVIDNARKVRVNGVDVFAKIEKLQQMLVRVSLERRATAVPATVESQIDDPMDYDEYWWK